MSEWWTYRLADFLMFSPATYQRLFELHNAAWWPAQTVAVALGSLAAWLGWHHVAAHDARRAGRADRIVGIVLALAWGLVAWAFLGSRLASIHWAAPGLAAAFALQAGLLAAMVLRPTARVRPSLAAPPGRRAVGFALWLLALAGLPLLTLALGRPASQSPWFGLMPDPTVLATFGALLWLPRGGAWWLWPLPLAWAAVGGATLWTMHEPDAWLLPASAAAALATRWRR